MTTKKARRTLRRTGTHGQSAPAPALLDVDSAAIYLGMSRSMLYKLLLSGEIQSIVLGRKFRRVPLKACDQFIEEQTGRSGVA